MANLPRGPVGLQKGLTGTDVRRQWTFTYRPHMTGGRRRCSRTYLRWLQHVRHLLSMHIFATWMAHELSRLHLCQQPSAKGGGEAGLGTGLRWITAPPRLIWTALHKEKDAAALTRWRREQEFLQVLESDNLAGKGGSKRRDGPIISSNLGSKYVVFLRGAEWFPLLRGAEWRPFGIPWI